MAKATFEGIVLSFDKLEGSAMAVTVHVDFVLMVRSCSMDLHKHKEDKNYWKPVRFSCPARAPYKLQSALIELKCGDYITVETEKDGDDWKVIDITFAQKKAEDFRELLAFNEEIL